MPGTIDVHHHLIPARFTELWFASIEKARGLQLPKWLEEGTLNAIGEVGLGTAIVSLGHPVHPYVKDPAQIGPVCREINEYTAKFRDARPDKIGFFATLPPLDQPETCLAEIAYGLDVLGADGVVVFSSYAAKYLGHGDFRPIWSELNRRGAVVLVHPGFEGMAPIEEPRLLAAPIVDWTHETTRTAVHLITTDTMRDFSDVNIVLSHAGGTLPYVINRAANLCCRLRIAGRDKKTEQEFVEEARRFYIDVAFSGHEPQLRLLREFAAPGHEHADVMKVQLAATDAVFAKETRLAGLKLFPRLAKYQ
ncbi:amidohydrolase family protein [Diplogelasinospora grovesii]|uniref:6-methylsalicylate decarboxylase n=1 Tax=Diplogelasinospora grovesii TaxID=303347 RepID=A0AAN6RZE4_9PEZI|nr:amidohydrolase family protein [Diplogelasinospora grovesii]